MLSDEHVVNITINQVSDQPLQALPASPELSTLGLSYRLPSSFNLTACRKSSRMSSGDNNSFSSKTTAKVALVPACFDLPSASLHCIGSEAALRFRRINFETTRQPASDWVDFTKGLASGIIIVEEKGDFSVKTKSRSLEESLTVIKRGNHGLDDGLSDSLRGTAAAIKSLAYGEMFPLLQQIMFNDAACVKELREKGVVRTPSFWERGPQFNQAAVSEALRQRTNLEKAEITATLLEHFTALEGLMTGFDANLAVPATLDVSGADLLEVPFFAGTKSPSTIDCYVYPAASFIVHGNFPSSAKEITNLQNAVRTRCPFLVRYCEMIRQSFFTQYSGYYSLRAIPSPKEAAAAEENDAQFRQGRYTVLFGTFVFATLYFTVSNADVILAVLKILLGDEGEVAEAEAEAAQQETPPEGDQQQSAPAPPHN